MTKKSLKRFWRQSSYNQKDSMNPPYALPPRKQRRASAKALWKVLGKK